LHNGWPVPEAPTLVLKYTPCPPIPE
jgi:hypothetical protein